MSGSRPDSDPAETTSASISTTRSTDSTISTGSGSVTSTPSNSVTPTSSIPSTLITSVTSSTSARTVTLSDGAVEASNATETEISWGPAITAIALASTTTAAAATTPTVTAKTHSGGSNSLPVRTRDIIVCTTVIGGVLVLALLIYVIIRRRGGATASEILHFRRHPPSTILLTPGPREPKFAEFPIYRESRYSVHSSKHGSLASFPKGFGSKAPPVPSDVARNFHYQNPYVKNMWKTGNPPTRPASPTRHTHSTAADRPTAGPESAKVSKVSVKTVGSRRPEGARSQKTFRDITKSWISISETPLTGPDRDGGMSSPSPPTSPTTPRKPEVLDKKDPSRWSWTNADAPATPRMYAPSLTSSISSLPKFKTIKSWVKGQAARIPEESRPTTSSSSGLRKIPSLRNKASFPTLAPVNIGPVTNKLSKKHARNGSGNSGFAAHPGMKVPLSGPQPAVLADGGLAGQEISRPVSPLSVVDADARAGRAVEMRQLSR